MSDKLRRNPKVVWREEPGGVKRSLEGGEGACLTLVHLGTMYQLNLAALEMWKLCDGTRGVVEIAAELAPRFDVEEAELTSDLEAFAGEMLAKGWLERC